MDALSPAGSWLAELTRIVSQSDPVFVGSAIAIFGIGCVVSGYFAWRALHHARLIQDTPTAKARSAHQGYVELEGVARMMDGAPTLARLSGLSCVWYRYRIEEQITTHYKGQAQRRWKVIDQGTSSDTFWLEDDTGRVAVDPEGADVMPKYKDVWKSRSRFAGIAQPAFIAGFLATRHGGNPYRFTEERINHGDPIYAIGLLKNLGSHADTPTTDTMARTLLREWKQDQAGLLERFDLNQDGNIDQKEWLLARRMARREAQRERRSLLANAGEGVNLLTHPKDRNRPFLISAFLQTELVRRYLLGSLLYGAGFFALGIAGIWAFNIRFG